MSVWLFFRPGVDFFTVSDIRLFISVPTGNGTTVKLQYIARDSTCTNGV